MSSEAMREAKDPVIKLFGKLIPLPKSDFPSNLHTEPDAGSQIPVISDLKDFCGGMKKIEAKDDDVEDCGNQEKSSVSEDDKLNQTHKNKDEPQVGSKMEDNTGITDTSEEKVPKKTDKIIPCPRCTSLETKFCYFNNYNVNQPRHFCRNCQRYWTDGGTMRKVAVGAGRRKNKHLGTHYCQLLVPHVTIQSTTDKNPEIVDQHVISHDESLETSKTSAGNEKLLKFDFKKPLCESLGALSPRDWITCADIGSIGEIKEEQSQCVSSLTSVHDDEILEKSFRDKQGGLSGSRKTLIPRKPLPCFTTPKWNSTWNACWNSTSPLRATPPVVAAQFNSEPTRDSNDTKPDQINWCSSPVMAVHGLCPPTIQFVPVPYWGLSCWPVTTSDIPLAESGTNYQATGKHSRDEVLIEAETSKKHVIVPKMLRVDPDEASKSRKH